MNDQNAKQDKQAVLQSLDKAREHIRSVLNRIKLDMEIYPTWTIKHVLAHLSGWDEACIASVEALLNDNEGEMVALRGADFYNAQSVETRQTLDYEQVRRECEITREQLKKVIDRVPEERMRDVVALPWGGKASLYDLLESFAEHEAEHAVEISALIDEAEAAHERANGETN